jgi:sterol desaturase/sphingolipid hydroxylase (fatty acid hydroxylase superfamily)
MIALAVVLGALTWTLLEYVIHRFAGHQHRNNGFAAEHLRHHAEGDYFAPAWKKAGAAVVVFGGSGVPAVALAGGLGLAWSAGLAATYLAYEFLHWRLHVSSGFGAYGRWARRHHFTHHFHGAKFNHGVTTPIWDHVFGTYKAPPEVIRVPRRVVMPWLVSAQGALRQEHAGAWALR